MTVSTRRGREADAELEAGPRMGVDPERERAFSALFDREYARMVRVARVLVGDEQTAEDVVQDAFVSVYASWHRIRSEADTPGYLYRSVVNGARSRLRRLGVARRLHLAPASAVPSAEDAALAGLATGPLLTVLRTLSRREREVVLLRYYLDLSEAETAGILGLSRGSVKAYGSRGLAALRSTLAALSRHHPESGSRPGERPR